MLASWNAGVFSARVVKLNLTSEFASIVEGQLGVGVIVRGTVEPSLLTKVARSSHVTLMILTDLVETTTSKFIVFGRSEF